MTVKTGSREGQDPLPGPSQTRQDQTNLDYRYGDIGIEAVAAAARYCDKRQSAAPASPVIDQRFIEFAN